MDKVIPTRGNQPLPAMPRSQYDRSVDDNGMRAPGSGGFTPPMWLKKASTTEVLVTSATVNGIIPTDINTPLTVTGTATWNIYLHATLGSDGIPTAVEVVASSSAVPADDDSNAYLLIGQAAVTSGVITAINPMLAWSQTFVTCGRNMDADPVVPGTYFWQVA